MDYLRDAIWQEGYAQKEPIGVFRQEGYELFHKMLDEIRRQVTEQLFSLQIAPASTQATVQYAGPEIGAMHEERLVPALPYDADGLDDGVQLDKDADGDESEEPEIVVQQRDRASTLQPVMASAALPASGTRLAQAPSTPGTNGADGKVGRNDPCPCGSGKKYKLCHGQKK
jgi:preprotein translocase subunit SecA